MIILFDLDGTLIDSTEAILESFEKAYEKFNTPYPSHQAIKEQIGYPLDDMFFSLGVKKEEVPSYVNAYKEHYRQISCLKTFLLKDALSAIKLASKSATLGVVTTKTAKYSIELLEYMGVMEYFDVLIGREDVTHPKPHPQPIQKALKKLSYTPTEKIYMIGDTPMDMLSAKASGVIGVGVTCGYGSPKALEESARYLFSSALEAVTFIVEQQSLSFV